MTTFVPFQTQLVSIMDTLAKTAVFEICKLVDIESRGLKQEISRSQREIVSLKNKLHMMQNLIWTAGERERNATCEDRVRTTQEQAPKDQNPLQHTTDIPHIKREPSDETPVSQILDDFQVGNEQSSDTHEITPIKEEQLEVKLCNSNPSEMLSSCEDDMGLGSDEHVRTLLTDKEDGDEGASDSAPPALLTTTTTTVRLVSDLSRTLQPDTHNGETFTEPHQTTPKRNGPSLFQHNRRTFGSLTTSQRHGLTTSAQWSGDQGPDTTQNGETSTEPHHHQTTPKKAAPSTLFQPNTRTFGSFPVSQKPGLAARATWSGSSSGDQRLSGDRRFICNYCSKRFRCISQLETHQRSHTGEKPFHCTLCGKRYAQKGHLYIHQRTHTGEKPYRCLTCGKGFIQKCTLDMHQRTHTGEKPFRCLRCGKGFTKKCNLKKHQASHMELGGAGDCWGPY